MLIDLLFVLGAVGVCLVVVSCVVVLVTAKKRLHERRNSRSAKARRASLIDEGNTRRGTFLVLFLFSAVGTCPFLCFLCFSACLVCVWQPA